MLLLNLFSLKLNTVIQFPSIKRLPLFIQLCLSSPVMCFARVQIIGGCQQYVQQDFQK